MKLKDQVCSLELAKKLKELNVKQDSYLYWTRNVINTKWLVYPFDYLKHFHKPNEERYSAFTVAELGEMLPSLKIITYKNDHQKGYLCIFEPFINGRGLKGLHAEFANTEADARAKMLIYLLEERKIILEEK